MKTCLKTILIAMALHFPLNASALDASTTVTITPLIKSTHNWDNKPIIYPKGQAEVTGLLIEIAPGAATGWHKHPVPSFAMILQGTLEVTLKSGATKQLHAGEALIEVVDTDHVGRNVGDIPVRLVVFYAGVAGQVLTITSP